MAVHNCYVMNTKQFASNSLNIFDSKEIIMSKLVKNRDSLVSINWLKNIYKDHPNMIQVNALKEKLKQEKLEDKVFCQSIKEKIATEQ